MKTINKLLSLVWVLAALSSTVTAQMQLEQLDRGAVAVVQEEGLYLSWRLLADEPYELGFNIYRNGTKVNDQPITDRTNYFDAGASAGSTYSLKQVLNGKELKMPAEDFMIIGNTDGPTAAYFDIPIQQPAQGVNRGRYSPNDGSTADLDGDGRYEIVLKWSPNNAKDNSHRGISDQIIIDAYTLEGKQLWRIELGPNIRSGAHYNPFLVYDFDGDGRAELMVKTAPGSRDASGAYLSKGPAAAVDHTANFTNEEGYILEGPEYLTVFDGRTGLELATEEYWPARGIVADWGDSRGNRVDRFNAAVAYVDGKRPSAIFQRGYYTRMTMAAWDWRDGKLSRRWSFDSDAPGNRQFAGQGNHSIHVIDANGDGKHDIVTGSAVIASDGTGMHTSRMGHGDATHVTYMIKNSPYPQIFMPHETRGHGVSLRHAHNSEIIFNHRNPNDVGRGVGAEIDPEVPGFHFWGTHGMGLYDMKGDSVGRPPRSMNFVIWWDGDLSRELLSGSRIEKWSIRNNSSTVLLQAEGAASINGTKSTPVLQADLFGDWREEVVLRRADNEALRVYTTTIPSKHRLYTLMHDPVYRVAVSWQNSSYNQPPHPGFYLASDMDFPQVLANHASGVPVKPSAQRKITVYGIGDSTMANKRNPETNKERGWGMVLQQFFDTTRVKVDNRALNGRSTKSFIKEKRWQVIVDSLHAGDYVLIQFGHNDQKADKPAVYADVDSAYRENLTRFVNETRAKGAFPVLLTSVVRRHFDEKGVLLHTHGKYPDAVRQLARELNVPLIDMEKESRKIIQAMGDEPSKRLFMISTGKDDNTHFVEEGAVLMAGIVARAICEIKLPLCEFVVKK